MASTAHIPRILRKNDHHRGERAPSKEIHEQTRRNSLALAYNSKEKFNKFKVAVYILPISIILMWSIRTTRNYT